jgi:hypothetical protein
MRKVVKRPSLFAQEASEAFAGATRAAAIRSELDGDQRPEQKVTSKREGFREKATPPLKLGDKKKRVTLKARGAKPEKIPA